MKNEIQLIGQKSPLNSAFAVFEHFSSWKKLKEEKKLPEGVYFAVLVIANKNKSDIYPDLFVQGYRPHSSGAHIHVETRGYGAFVPSDDQIKSLDDLVFEQAQLYQVKGNQKVELVLRNGECQSKIFVCHLVSRICAERNLERLSDIKHYRYRNSVSVGYFLAEREYEVWSLLVGVNTGFSLEKKVLIMDYYTGIPAIISYEDKCFKKIGDQ